eukprot:10668373-Alexandrium_andersonii.AAC.1
MHARARAVSSGGPCDVRVPHSTRSEVPGFGVSRPCPSTCLARALALILEQKVGSLPPNRKRIAARSPHRTAWA